MVISRSFIKPLSNVNLLYYLPILPLHHWELITRSSFKDTTVFALRISFCWHNYSCLFQAHVFSSGPVCAAFLSNSNSKSAASVTFRSRHYNLPPWSVSILPDCKNEVFNTAKVHEVLKYSDPLSYNYRLNLNILSVFAASLFDGNFLWDFLSVYCIHDFIL